MPSATPSKQRIVITVGLPACGKSTYLERFRARAISSDEIRGLLADDPRNQKIHKRVFATVRYLLRHRLAVGRPVTYVDATHLTPKERRPYLEIGRKYGCPVDVLYFDVPLEICLRRNRKRDRKVPESAMRRMQAKLVPPSKSEGFRTVKRIRNR
jgi:predicted kinase